MQLVGTGTAARVYRRNHWAIKVAHPNRKDRQRLRREYDIFSSFQATSLKLPRPAMFEEERFLLARPFVELPRLLTLLGGKDTLSPLVVEQLFRCYREAFDFEQMSGTRLDFSPANLYIDVARAEVFLVDLGERLAPPALPRNLEPHQIVESLRQACSEQVRLAEDNTLQPFHLPPSGRFHVNVPMGLERGAKLRWINHRTLQWTGLSWNRNRLAQLTKWTTFAPETIADFPASRYKDSPGHIHGGAQGDGRVVYLGTVGGGRYGRRELQLKGCGATELAWHGHQYHEDGLVSFARTLWETSVCDELTRLGFDVPQVLAISTLPKETVDNTERPWVAGSSLRIADSFFRYGHLDRYTDDTDALKTILKRVGTELHGATFDPQNLTHLKDFVFTFCSNLGAFVGQTDALNIQSFNPTAGNIRCDGQLIDFSSVRFFRYSMPNYRILDGAARAKDHRNSMRRKIPQLLRTLAQGGLLDKSQQQALTRRGRELFEESYVEGYLQGLNRYLEFDASALSATQRRDLVDDTTKLRFLRAEETVAFPFFRQEHPGPLFDLEGKLPEFVHAWNTGERAPWRRLRSNFAGTIDDFAKYVITTWWDTMRRCFPGDVRPRLRAHRFDEVIRPFMEVNALASLCYQRSPPDNVEEWASKVSAGWDSPPLRVRLPGPNRGTTGVIKGLTESMHNYLMTQLEGVFDDRLLGAAGFGPRVMLSSVEEVQDSVEHPLTLRIVITNIEGDDRAKLLAAIEQMGFPFRLTGEVVIGEEDTWLSTATDTHAGGPCLLLYDHEGLPC